MAGGLKSWNGEAYKRRAETASIQAVNKVMADAVRHAKGNHPGWKNVTGTAEGSITVVEFAKNVGGTIRGLWGSRGVHYFIWLELKYGSALRRAADAIYPRLAGYLREAFRSAR